MENMARKTLETKPAHFVAFERDDLNSSIVARFEKQVELYPDNIAVKQGDITLSYTELNQAANRLGLSIIEEADGYEGPITFLLDHGVSPIIAILGIAKAGCAYVVLDPSFPQDRLAFMISDSQTPLLLTDSTNLELARELSTDEVQVINLDDIDNDKPSDNLDRATAPDTMFLIQYTSGSTGQPKGCVKTHLMELYDVMTRTNQFCVTPNDRFILATSVGFGLSMNPILNSLLNGGCVLPYDIKKEGFIGLKDFLINEKITVLTATPTIYRNFASLLNKEHPFPDLRFIALGGEPVTKTDVDLHKKHFPSTCNLQLGFGGSEFQEIRSIIITKDTQLPEGQVPVGYAIEGKKVLLLDEDGIEVPTGEVGEITVQSKYIATRYWRRPELSAEKFKSIPGLEGVIQYRTGDLGRMDTEGCLFHMGRNDRQVKIRGYRVEIGGIRSAILDLPSIKDVYVKAFTTAGETQLVAYLILKKGVEQPVGEIRKALTNKMPASMVPSGFIILDEFPMTPVGKIDESALPTPLKDRSKLSSDLVEPSDLTEMKLVEIWEKLLRITPVGIDDDFFEAGGDSLLAMRLAAEIEDIFDMVVPVPALVEVRTIRELAPLLFEEDAFSSWSDLVELQTQDQNTKLFLVPPSAGTVIIFNNLAKYISEDYSIYGLEYSGMEAGTEPHDTMEALAQYNVEKIRELQPEGPYYICGMCYGGLVAYEMAQQFVEMGQKVAFLGILDTNFAPQRKFDFKRAFFLKFLQFCDRFLSVNPLLGHLGLTGRLKKHALKPKVQARIKKVFVNHTYARLKYASQPYPGLITYFGTRRGFGPALMQRWQDSTAVEMDVVEVPGSHERVVGEHPFMAEQNVQKWAHLFKDCLDKAA